ncbi:MAG TPA: MFS transporter [Actinomycetes bacterium]|jgi:MFS family permease|nr:MFS transporter [Actinomycetes bacterium]
MPVFSLAPYRVLLRAPGTLRLVSGALLGRMSAGMGGLALLLLVQSSSGSFALAGAVVGAYTIATSLFGPVQGRVIDRYGQTWVLVGSGGVHAVALVWLGLAGPGTGGLVGGAVLAGMARPPVAPAMRALWSRLADGPSLQTAYALESTSQELVFVTGPLLVAVLVSVASPAVAIVVTAGLTLAGTLVFATSPVSRAWRGAERARDWAGPLRSRGFRTLVVVQPLVAVSIGALEVAVAAFATGNGSRGAAGVLLAVWSGGSLAGGLLAGARHWRGPVERRYLALLLAFLAAMAALLVARSNLDLGVLIVLAGLPFAPWIACVYLLADRLAPPGTVTEAFTWVMTAFTAGLSAGSSLAGLLIDGAGVRAAFLAAVAAGVLAVGVTLLRRHTLVASPAG